MKRVNGNIGVKVIECVNPVRDRWHVRWDVQEDSEGLNYMEEIFNHKPSVAEIKSLIIEWHNSQIDRKILKDFVWNDKPVWLSTENQFNFKSAYDLTVQLQGANLPVKMKLGELNDGSPSYYTFDTAEDFKDFYLASVEHIQTSLTNGWQTKDSIDWNEYEVDVVGR